MYQRVKPSFSREAPGAAPLTIYERAAIRSLVVGALELQLSLRARHEEAVRALEESGDLTSEEGQVAALHLSRTIELIHDLRHALDRVDAGTYGCCEVCGRAIPFERLEAIPQTRVCVACPEPLR